MTGYARAAQGDVSRVAGKEMELHIAINGNPQSLGDASIIFISIHLIENHYEI